MPLSYLCVIRICLHEHDGGQDGRAEHEDAGEGVRGEEVPRAAVEGTHVVSGVDQGTCGGKT